MKYSTFRGLLQLVFFCSTTLAFSQKKILLPHKLSFGLHVVNLEDTKFAVDYFKIDYSKHITRHSSLATSVGFISYFKENSSKYFPEFNLPEEQDKGFSQDNVQQSMIMANINYQYNFEFLKRSELIVSLGPTVAYAIEVYSSGGSSEYIRKNDGTSEYQYTNYSSFEKQSDIGLNALLGYNYHINKKIDLGMVVNFQKYLLNNVSYVYAAGINVGYRF